MMRFHYDTYPHISSYNAHISTNMFCQHRTVNSRYRRVDVHFENVRRLRPDRLYANQRVWYRATAHARVYISARSFKLAQNQFLQ